MNSADLKRALEIGGLGLDALGAIAEVTDNATDDKAVAAHTLIRGVLGIFTGAKTGATSSHVKLHTT